jgi:hypothetical protein
MQPRPPISTQGYSSAASVVYKTQIQKGIRKGGLKRPEDAKLLLGEAELHAGHRNRAVQAFKSVRGTDGAADIARLWVLEARA